MKNTIFIVLSIFINFFANAQLKIISEGKPFEEPSDKSMRIIQLSNGNTISLVYKGKKGIDLQAYDNFHSLIAEKNIMPSFCQLDANGGFNSMEINGDLVLFQRNFRDGEIPMLTRVIIDGKTAEIKEDKKIFEMERATEGHAYDKVADKWRNNANFRVKVNPSTGSYVVLLEKGLSQDPTKGIEIVCFNKNHVEINKAKVPLSTSYKYCGVYECQFLNEDSICLIWAEYNIVDEKPKLKYQISFYSISKNTFATKEFDIQSEYAYLRTFIDEKMSRIYFLTLNKYPTQKKKFINPVFEKEYIVKLSVWDLKANELMIIEKDLSSNTIFNSTYLGYRGVPQDLIIKENGDIAIIYEELSRRDNGSKVNSTESHLGNIIVANFNKNIELVSTSFIPHHHRVDGYDLGPFFNRFNFNFASHLNETIEQYSYFGYVNTKDGLLMFNDLEENEEKGQDGNPKMISGIGDAIGFCFNTSESKPKRQYVFGKPENGIKNLGLFTIMDYDPKSKILCTCKRSSKGRKNKELQLVWLQL